MKFFIEIKHNNFLFILFLIKKNYKLLFIIKKIIEYYDRKNDETKAYFIEKLKIAEKNYIENEDEDESNSKFLTSSINSLFYSYISLEEKLNVTEKTMLSENVNWIIFIVLNF